MQCMSRSVGIRGVFLEEIYGRAAQATSMPYSDATEHAIVQRDRDGRIRVGKIHCVGKLEWAEVVGDSEAEVARCHLVLLRQRHRRGRHGQVLQGRVHGTVLVHLERSEGTDDGALGWEHSSRSLEVRGCGFGDDAQVFLESTLTLPASECHLRALK